VHDGHFLAAGCDGVLECKFQQAAAALTRVHARSHGDGMRVIVDLDVILMSDVQAFQILAHHHEIDFFEAPAGDQSTCRPQICIQLELLPQAHVGGSVTSPRRGFERTFESQARAPDALEGLGWERVACRFDSLQAGDLRIPCERRPERFECGKRCVDDFRADPIAGDQCGWD